MKIQLPTQYLSIANTIIEAGFQVYLVGGCIRDKLLNFTPKDYDFVVDAPIDVIKPLFKKAYLIGKRHPLLHVYYKSTVVEVSSLQTSIENDAALRDFSINAIYYDVKNKAILDPVAGVKNLYAKQLCLLGNIHTKLPEDPLRIMRGIRIAAKLEFNIQKITWRGFQEYAYLLNTANENRLFDEFTKIANSENLDVIIKQLMQLNILEMQTLQSESKLQLIENFAKLTNQRLKKGKKPNVVLLLCVLFWQESYLKGALSIIKPKNLFIPKKVQLVMLAVIKMQRFFTNPKSHSKLLKHKYFRLAMHLFHLRGICGLVSQDSLDRCAYLIT